MIPHHCIDRSCLVALPGGRRHIPPEAINPLGQATTYTYDGDGKRVRMDDPTGTTIFIYDGNNVVAEVDGTGTIQVAYTRTPTGRLISQWLKGDTYWYHLDRLGSTISLTDESGAVKNKYGYDEYGNPNTATTPKQTTAIHGRVALSERIEREPWPLKYAVRAFL